MSEKKKGNPEPRKLSVPLSATSCDCEPDLDNNDFIKTQQSHLQENLKEVQQQLSASDKQTIPEKEVSSPYEVQVGGDHYKKKFPFCQPLEFFSRNKISFTKANVCKYVLRHDVKNGIEDLRKAKHYLEVIAWDEYGKVL